MLKNYLLVGFRMALRKKTIFSINVVGLAIGMAACLLISLWVADELSYDQQNTNSDQLYRLAKRVVFPHESEEFRSISSEKLGPALKDNFPEITAFARLDLDSDKLISYEEIQITNIQIAF